MNRYNNRLSIQAGLLSLSGNTFHVTLARMKILLEYKSNTEMKFTIIEGGGIVKTGYNETVPVNIYTIERGLFIVAWKEQSAATVSHVEDLENKILYSNITMPNGQFYNLIGNISSSDEQFIEDLPQRQYSEALHAKELQSDFKKFQLHLTFTKNDKVHLKWIEESETHQPPSLLDVSVTEIRPHILLITFKEEKGSTVALVLDRVKKTVWINISKKDHSLLSLEGTAKIIQH